MTLTADGPGGSDTQTRAGYIAVYELPVASFTAAPVNGVAPLAVVFTNTTTGTATDYAWDFGDGATSTEENPTHLYTAVGVYTVTLTVSGLAGTDAFARAEYITVLGADFTASPRVGPAPLAVTFTDILSDRVESRTWDFGDGATSTQENPTHAYTEPGVYTPTLTVVRGGYAYSETRPAFVVARGAEFNASPRTGYAPLAVTFTDLFTDTDTTYRGWNFGDGSAPFVTDGAIYTATHTYALGMYTPTLTVVRGGYTYTLAVPNMIAVTQPACAITTTQVVWWDDHFVYRQPLTLTVGAPLSYTPGLTQALALTLDTRTPISDGLMLSGGSDLRVVYLDADGWRELPRHIEGLDAATTTIYFPLQADIVATSAFSYYLYYGYVDPATPPELSLEGASVVTPTASLGAQESPVVVATICADMAAPQSFTSADGRQTFVFPPGAVTQTTVVTHTPYRVTAPQTSGYLERFDLVAQAATGEPVNQFDVPILLSLDYSTRGVDPAEEETIQYFYWDEAAEAWMPIPTSVDTEGNVAVAVVDHLTHFSVNSNFGLGGPPQLPSPALPGMGDGVDLLTGAATYAYPIEVPPGTHGMQPNLSLVYNSSLADTEIGAQAGIVGQGWSLAGVGYIRLGEDRQFYLNLNGVGAKLVAEPDFVPHDGVVMQYHTERETFWRIEVHENGNNGEWAFIRGSSGEILVRSPYWVVTTQDGTQHRFGHDQDSVARYIDRGIQSPYVYSLDQVMDVYGNRMSLSYSLSCLGAEPCYYDAALYPQDIFYTANDDHGLGTSRLILFTYDLPQYDIDHGRAWRSDRSSSFEPGPGQRYALDKALVSMQEYVDAALVRSYDLGYEYYTQNGETPRWFQGGCLVGECYGPEYYHLMLTGIAEYGSDGGALPSTTFSYTETGHLWTAENGYGGKVTYDYEEVTWADRQDVKRLRVHTREIVGGEYPAQWAYIYSSAAIDEDGHFIGHESVSVPMESTRYTFDVTASDPCRGNLDHVEIYDDGQSVLRTTSYSYDAHCRPTIIAQQSPAGTVSTLLQYDDYGNVQRSEQQMEAGGDHPVTIFEYDYDTTNWVVNHPRTMSFYWPEGVLVAQTDWDYAPSGQAAPDSVTVTRHDLQGGQNLVTTYEYDDYGNVGRVTDGGGNTTQVTYDAATRTFPQSVQYPGQELETHTTYDRALGVPRSYTDLNGNYTQYGYDEFGRVDWIDLPGGVWHDVDYDYPDFSPGLLVTTAYADTTSRDDELRWQRQEYNAVGQLQTECRELTDNGDLACVSYHYDNLGQLKTVSDPFPGGGEPAGMAEEYWYDHLGRLVRAFTPQNGTTTYDYDDAEREVTVTDDNENSTNYSYDWLGRVRATTDAEGHTTTYAYDPLGGLGDIWDANGNHTWIGYDSLGRKITMSDPDMGEWHYTYDAAGSLATQTDGRGCDINFEYDGLNRLRLKTYSGVDCSGSYVEYTYDEGENGAGHRTGMTDGSGTTTWAYDARGQMIEENKVIGGSSFTTRFTFDALGRLRTLTYPDGEEVTNNYDSAGYLDGITSGYASGTIYLTNADYNLQGQVESLTLGNNVPVSYGYDPVRHLPNSIEVGPDGSLLQIGYPEYDPVGNLAQMVWDGLTLNYDYDALNRLVGVTGDEDREYTYDVLGNLRYKRNGEVDLTLDYSWPEDDPSPASRPHAVQGTSDDTAFDYDDNGNVVFKEIGDLTIEFGYDAEDRLTQVISPTGSAEATFDFLYDGDDRLVKQTGDVSNLPRQHYYVNDFYERTDTVHGIEIRSEPHYGSIDAVAGRIYVAWGYDSYELTYAKNTNGTWQTYETGVPINPWVTGAQGFAGGGLDLAVYNNGDSDVLNATWSEPRFRWSDEIGWFVFDSVVVYFARSADGGMTWSEPVALGQSDPWVNSLSGAVSLAADGQNLYVVWIEKSADCDGCYRLVYRHSGNGGGSWGGRVTLDEIVSGNGDAEMYDYPDVVATDGGAAVVWSRYDPDTARWGVRVRRLSGSAGLEEPLDGARCGDARYPRIAAGADGALHVVWHSGDEQSLCYRRWLGRGWSEYELLPGSADGGGDIVVDESGKVFVGYGAVVASRDGAAGGGSAWETVAAGSAGSAELALGEGGALHIIQTTYWTPLCSGPPEAGGCLVDLTIEQQATQHYYASGQRIAMRVTTNNLGSSASTSTLYYTLNDALGSTSVVMDESGTPLSRTRYDPFGGVQVTQVWEDGDWGDPVTTPITQTDYLYRGDLLQRELNLYMTGDGRLYDPRLGKYLQPDAIGGPPLLPQAADRYQVAGNSPTGCGACQQGGGGLPLSEIIGVGKDIAFEVLGRRSIQTGVREFALLRVTASRTALTTNRYVPRAVRELYGFNVVGEGSYGRVVAESAELSVDQTRLLKEWYLDWALPRGRGIGLGEAEVVVTRLDPVYGRLGDIPWWNIADVGLDFVLGASFQLVEDVGNPRLTSAQVWGRAAVAGGGGALSSLAGGAIGAKIGLAVSPLCGPGAPVCVVVFVVGGEFVGGWAWQRWGQPRVFELFGLGQAPLRLKPLTAQ